MRNCIVVLTRGYEEIKSYDTLIKRNKHIAINLNDKTIDNLIFHEGNISEEQQLYIKSQTPELKMQFVDISSIAFLPEKKHIVIEKVHSVGLSYRHMCSFWFVNFFDAVTNYDKLLRIDEDCFIDSNIDSIFSLLDKSVFVCASFFKDHSWVTEGMNDFSLDFIKRYKGSFTFKKTDKKSPEGPYTNVFGLSLQQIRDNIMFQNYKDDIDKSNMIYKRRWGDLPLWGEVIYYIFGDDAVIIDKNIRYLHGSHGIYTNSLIINKKYSWQNSSITFLENGEMRAFGNGHYKETEKNIVEAVFGSRKHLLTFNEDYTEFISVREGDNEIVKGKIILS